MPIKNDRGIVVVIVPIAAAVAAIAAAAVVVVAVVVVVVVIVVSVPVATRLLKLHRCPWHHGLGKMTAGGYWRVPAGATPSWRQAR